MKLQAFVTQMTSTEKEISFPYYAEHESVTGKDYYMVVSDKQLVKVITNDRYSSVTLVTPDVYSKELIEAKQITDIEFQIQFLAAKARISQALLIPMHN